MSERVVIFNNMITPYTNRLYNELVVQGAQLAVVSCTEQESDRAWRHSLQSNYEHIVVPGFSIRLARARHTHFNFGIARALRRLAPKVLLINGFYYSMVAASLWAIRTRTPLALTTDGWRITMPDTPYHRMIRPFIVRHCKAVIACSVKGRDFFSDLGVADQKISIVPLVPAWDAPSHAPAYHERPFDILWCARVNDDPKNAIFFEEVLDALKKQRPSLTVRIVGNGPAEMRLLARLTDLEISFRHDSYLDWRSISEAFCSARLLMLPSLWECWGLVCNEAMQCGTPCIVSTNVGAADELIVHRENGLVFDLNIELWAAGALELLGNPERWASFSDSARIQAAKFSLAKAVENFKAAIDGIA
jgi:glycosyltransferase involved in cell wall biosynthesis